MLLVVLHVCFTFFQIRSFFSYEIVYLTNLSFFSKIFFQNTFIWKIIQPMVSDSMKQTLNIVRDKTKMKKLLLKEVDAENLRKEYGGLMNVLFFFNL